MLNQENDTDSAKALFNEDQNVAHDELTASGALDEQPHKLAEAKEKAEKKKAQKVAREAAKKKLNDDICALAKKHDQSVAVIKLRVSQMKMVPVDTLDTSLENEQKIEELKMELRIVESLYQELLMKVDDLTEKDPNKFQGTVEDFSKELGISMDEAAEVLVRPSSVKEVPLYVPQAELMETAES